MEKNLIVRIRGGLGNQLFIYSAAKYLATMSDRQLILDTKIGFRNDSYSRHYLLDYLGIKESLAGWLVTMYIYFLRRLGWLSKKFLPDSEFLETNGHESIESLETKVMKSPTNIYLVGYFQSSVYFNRIEALLRQSIKYDVEQNRDILNLKQSIVQKYAVAVHFRRDRYPQLLDVSYYHKAIQILEDRLEGDLTFFIFSDDHAFSAAHFEPDGKHIFVHTKDETGISDLFLMSHCRHFIVANSSFSWWGAQLGNDPNKLVVAPVDSILNKRDDFYPPDWILI